MHTPVEITFRAMDASPAMETAVRKWVERLEQAYDRIERCAVVVEQPHRHHRQGNQFAVHVYLTIPDRTIAITRDPSADQTHENAFVALDDAFRAARRQLQDHAQIVRGEIKAHA
ncbi:MAG: ribosome-associated translation inhibitor RaiA [Kofleriaceae bacterium]|nr:ribosome-associated translation inhibitor RaiA [Kofleriaceae bacterium]